MEQPEGLLADPLEGHTEEIKFCQPSRETLPVTRAELSSAGDLAFSDSA